MDGWSVAGGSGALLSAWLIDCAAGRVRADAAARKPSKARLLCRGSPGLQPLISALRPPLPLPLHLLPLPRSTTGAQFKKGDTVP